MKKLLHLLFVCFFFAVSEGISQVNLVPNPSFEEYSICPNNPGQLQRLNNWYNPNLHSPDYFNECFITGTYSVNVPDNWFGYQFAKTGIGYSGIGVAKYSNTREYLAIKLNYSLISNKKYCVSFFVSLADSCNYGTDAIGVYFSIDSIFMNDFEPMPFSPQISNQLENYLISKNEWIEISGEFIASGGELYLILGNFNDDANTNSITVDNGGDFSNPSFSGAYYYIDDVQVVSCDSSVSVNEINNNFKLLIYPNPSEDYLIIESNFNLDNLLLYDINGQKISTDDLCIQKLDEKWILNLKKLNSGIYYILNSELGVSKSFIVNH